MCMVEMAIFNIQRAITLKLGKQELRLMCSACHLMVLTFVSSFMKICQVVLKLWIGDFRCGALLFMVIHVIYKYKNK